MVQFHVAYEPHEPHLLPIWCAGKDLIAAINGGFFDERYRTTALVISDGVKSGSSYEGQGGMFAVDTSGNVSLRSLSEQPYTPNEPLVEALQGWPMLVAPGGRLAYDAPQDTDRARRSVLATDRSGHVLLLVFASSTFTLNEVGAWLLASDLAVDAALNLDGGSSSGLCFQSGNEGERVDAFVPLPTVLMVRRPE